MWRWLQTVLNALRGKKKRRLKLTVAQGSFAYSGATADMRRMRIGWPPTVRRDLPAAANSFGVTGQAATLTYTPQTQQLAWQNLPPLSVVQGNLIDLTQYVVNPEHVTLAYSVATSSHPTIFPSGVTLSTGGTIAAAPNAELGTLLISFNATTSTGQHAPLDAGAGSFSAIGNAATLTPPVSVGPVTMTVDTIPYTGIGLYLGSSGVSSKNVQLCQVGNLWYKVGGDHNSLGATAVNTNPAWVGNTPGTQDGRNEIFEINFATNTWTLKQPYFLRSSFSSSPLQCSSPDDPSSVTVTDRGEIWIVANEGVINSSFDWYNGYYTNGSQDEANRTPCPDPALYYTQWLNGTVPDPNPTLPDHLNYLDGVAKYPPGNIVRQELKKITAWNPVTMNHRAVLPRPWPLTGDRSWFSAYDQTTRRIITPISGAGMHTLLIAPDGSATDVTTYYGAGQNVLSQYGNYVWHNGGIVLVGRRGYLWDLKFGQILSFSLDGGPGVSGGGTEYADKTPGQSGYQNGVLKLECTIPSMGNVAVGNQQFGHMVWHPGVQALILATRYGTGGHIAAYQPGTGIATDLGVRRDGWTGADSTYVAPSSLVYDSVTGYCYSVGGIDWSGSFSSNYWRLAFTAT